MRHLICVLAFSALGACSAPKAEKEAETPVGQTTQLASPTADPTSFAIEGQHGFAAAFYNAVGQTQGNQFVSPFSVETAFALLYPGARGETAGEIARVFGFSSDPAQAAAQTRALMDAIRAGETPPVTIANAAWVEQTFPLQSAYTTLVRDRLGGAIEAVNFRGTSDAARTRINSWAAENTNNRIRDLLPVGSVSGDTRLVLTNAVFFKADWADQFTREATRPGPFHLAGGGEAQAQLMHQTTNARYFETDTFQAAEFDYAGGQFALDVFLPRAANGLSAFEQNLDGARLNALLTQLNGANRAALILTLPKVTMESSYELGGVMQAVGVRTAFTGQADFTGVSTAEGLAISRVIHRTFLAIDEKGTEAAAATAITMEATAAPPRPGPEPIRFTADRPFFIVLKHKPTGEILFMGRVTRPGE